MRVRAAIDLSGNVGAVLSPVVKFRIIDTALASGPPDFSNVKSPEFVFSSLTGVRFECSVDSAVLADCGIKDPANNRGFEAFLQPL